MRSSHILVVLSTALVLTGCDGPQGRIEAKCLERGGVGELGSSRVVDSASLTDVQKAGCSCVAKQLKSTLSDEQLSRVSEALDAPNPNAAMNTLAPATQTAVMGAAKSCSHT